MIKMETNQKIKQDLKIKMLEEELCAKDNSYRFCKL